MTSRELFRAEQLLAAGSSVGPVLGLETGTPVASLGLIANGRPLASLSRRLNSHGEKLPELVDELLDCRPALSWINWRRSRSDAARAPLPGCE